MDLDLLDVDGSTEDSGGTTTVLSSTHVQFNADLNLTDGNIARWTDIDPGPDGDFSVPANRVTSMGTASFTPSEVMLQETVAKADQMIDFPGPADLRLDETPPALSATASSGLPVSFASNSESVSRSREPRPPSSLWEPARSPPARPATGAGTRRPT